MIVKPDIAIADSEWRIVRDILQRHVPRHPVWAFGSRARHTQKPFSDLDLVVICDQPLPLSTVAELYNAFSESDLPWKVDIVDWACIAEDFPRVIESHKVPVQ